MFSMYFDLVGGGWTDFHPPPLRNIEIYVSKLKKRKKMPVKTKNKSVLVQKIKSACSKKMSVSTKKMSIITKNVRNYKIDVHKYKKIS